MAQHVELMHPDGILDAEVQATVPEVLDARPLLDSTGYGPIPGPKKRKVTDYPAETQSLQAALKDVRTSGGGGLDVPVC
jgi:hypothetical protein